MDERIEPHRIAGGRGSAPGAAGPCRSRCTAGWPRRPAPTERGGSMVTPDPAAARGPPPAEGGAPVAPPPPAAGPEFWRDIKPIPKEKVFRTDAAPELF